MKTRHALLAVLLLASPARGGDVAPAWEVELTIPRGGKALAAVAWRYQGPRLQRVCADMDGAEQAVRQLRIVTSTGEQPLPVDTDDATCWRLPDDAPLPLRLAYECDLDLLDREHGDPDWAVRYGDELLFNDEAVLIRPDPLPRDLPITVTFHVAPGVSVATPWARDPTASATAPRFRYDGAQYDAGAYVAVGHLVALGESAIGGGQLAMALLDRPLQASPATLRLWIERAARAAVDFYGELPGGRIHVLVVPVPGSREPGVYGTVLRRGLPSVVLLTGSEASDDSYRTDWVAPHELFHTGNPAIVGRIPWFIEGFATYYQHLLLARSGALTAVQAWSELHDGFTRFCDPVASTPLGEESRSLSRTSRYQRVYWGGACVAFRLDVAIRLHSRGRRSLDDLVRELRVAGRRRPLDEAAIVRTLDRAAGAPLARDHLRARRPIRFTAHYRDLGVVPIAGDPDHRVRLDDSAASSGLRSAMF